MKVAGGGSNLHSIRFSAAELCDILLLFMCFFKRELCAVVIALKSSVLKLLDRFDWLTMPLPLCCPSGRALAKFGQVCLSPTNYYLLGRVSNGSLAEPSS